jgi:hypothetical protein
MKLRDEQRLFIDAIRDLSHQAIKLQKDEEKEDNQMIQCCNNTYMESFDASPLSPLSPSPLAAASDDDDV